MNKLSIEQLCKLFPYLRSEENQRDFNERYKQFFDIQNRTSECHIILMSSYRLRNAILPISVPRHLTPEAVCLLQACDVGNAMLKRSGVRYITSLSATQGTSMDSCIAKLKHSCV